MARWVIQVSEKFELDEDIKKLRSPYTKEFFETFKKGFDLYISGDWMKSPRLFSYVVEKGYLETPISAVEGDLLFGKFHNLAYP